MPRGLGGRLASVLAVVLVGFALVAGPAEPASAHATVVSTTPAHGSELDAAPAAVTVTFSEPVALSSLLASASVLDADGAHVEAGPATLDEARLVLTIPLPAALPVGAYIASWRVVSADTHPVGGSIQFGVGVPASAIAAPPPPAPSPALALGVGAAKGVLYLGLVLAFGLLPPALLLGATPCERRTIVRGARLGIGAAAFASLAQLVLQFLWIRSAGGGEAWEPETAAFASSPYALAVAVRLAALGLALVVLGGPTSWSSGEERSAETKRTPRARSPRGRVLALALLGLAAVATVVVAGHGGAGSWLLAASTFVHATAAIAWLGGLVPLALVLLRERLTPQRLRGLSAWSLYAGVALGLLGVSGLVQAASRVGGVEPLFETTYGGLLLAKLALVAAALVLGALGLAWTRRERGRGDGRPAPGRTARLRLRTRWEAGILALVVLLSGVLSSVTPAKDAWAPVATARTQVGPYGLVVEAAPARRGPQSLRITVTPPSPDVSPQLRAVLRSGEGVELPVELPYRLPAPLEPGRPTPVTFVSAAVSVPTTGTWTLAVTVVAGPLEQYAGEVAYDVR